MKDLPFRVPVEVVAGAFFLLIAAVMVGPGQEMGRAFNRVAAGRRVLGQPARQPRRHRDVRRLLAPPAAAGGVVRRRRRRARVLRPAAAGRGRPRAAPRPSERPARLPGVAVLLTVFTSGFFRVHRHDVAWSPYYRMDFISTAKIRGQQ